MWHHKYPDVQIRDNEGYYNLARVRTDADGNHHTSFVVSDRDYYQCYDVTLTTEGLWIHGGADRFAPAGRTFSLTVDNSGPAVPPNLNTVLVPWGKVFVDPHYDDFRRTVDGDRIVHIAIRIEGVKTPLVGVFNEADLPDLHAREWADKILPAWKE